MCRRSICLVCLFLTLTIAMSDVVRAEVLAHWKFDEGSGGMITDSSGNGHDGVISGTPQWVAGVYGGALDFHTTVGAEIPNFDVTGGTGSFSLAFWHLWDGTGNIQHFLTKSNGWGAATMVFQVENKGNQNVSAERQHALHLAYQGAPQAVLHKFPIDEWSHTVLVFDGTAGTATGYLNGEDIVGPQPTAIGQDVDSTVLIGVAQPLNRIVQGALDDMWLFSHVLSPEEIIQVMAGGADPRQASNPQPQDQATDVSRDRILSWTPGEYAVKHDLYFGSDFDDVNDADASDASGILISQGQEADSFDPERLAFGQTYYWRVDEVNAPSRPATFKGDVWSFTVERLAYPVMPAEATASSSFMPAMGPEKTIDGSGMNAADQHGTTGTDMWLSAPTDTERWIRYQFAKPQKLHEMWVWNSNQNVEGLVGFGLKDVTVASSLDGVTWTALADVPAFAQAPGASDYAHNTVVDFGGVSVKYVRITVQSGWGALPQRGLSEVRFYAIPVYASAPQPADGDNLDSVDATLAWRAGREADSHEVILSSNQSAVEDGSAVAGNTSIASFQPAPLSYGTEYFWRIVEINEVAETARYTGDIWSFHTPEYLVIDDFELYDDKEFLEIWAFWVDGYQNNANGAIVGNGNMGERDVVYQGRQSMPIHYDNSGAAISEVTRTFDTPLDWNQGAPTVLSLQVRGDAPSFIDGGDTLTVGGSGADIWNAADEFRFVYKSLSGNGSITAKVESLTHVDAWAKGGVMIRESLTAESSCAYTVATGTQGVTFQYRTTTFTSAASDSSTRNASWANQDDEPVWVRVERAGNEFNGYMSLDGVTWTSSVSNPQTINMVPDVKIGFCVTSHDNDQSSTAVFSNVSTTGNVSGNWMVETFGEGHPDNDPAPLYMVIADSNAREKTITHPDTQATVNTNWTLWQIPLSDLGPVNLGSIQKITIGVGQPGGSASGDRGTVYVDLLQVGTPLPVD